MEERKMKKNLLLLVLCTAAFLTFAVGSSSSDGDLSSGSTSSENKEELKLIDSKGYSDEYGIAYYIEGKIENTTDKKFSYAQITFNVYDKDGAVVGSCLDNQNDLLGGDVWKFKAICSGDAKAIKSFKYTGYSAY